MSGLELVTLKEAQFIVERPQEDLARAIDRGEVEKLTEVSVEPAPPAKRRRKRPVRGKGRRRETKVFGYQMPRTVKKTVRKLGPPELIYLAIEKQVHNDLTPAGRRKLYEAIKELGPRAGIVTIGPIAVRVSPVAKRLAQRYRLLKTVRAGIVEREGADPIIRGTGISAYVVAALAHGQSIEEILEDYPSLTGKQVRRAMEYAAAYPKPGRPYPKRSFKRAAVDLVSSGALDVEPPDEPLSPHMFG